MPGTMRLLVFTPGRDFVATALRSPIWLVLLREWPIELATRPWDPVEAQPSDIARAIGAAGYYIERVLAQDEELFAEAVKLGIAPDGEYEVEERAWLFEPHRDVVLLRASSWHLMVPVTVCAMVRLGWRAAATDVLAAMGIEPSCLASIARHRLP